MDIRHGYHYTSIENWRDIEKDGLTPYSIKQSSLIEVMQQASVEGVWVWKAEQTGISHIGCILYQVATKGTLAVVCMSVFYDYDSLLTAPNNPNRLIELPHDGWIGKLRYHDSSDLAVVSKVAIPPERLRLEKVYKLADAWHGQETLRER